MARQQNNSVMHGTTGLFNSQVVFKTRKGKVYVAGPPTIDPNRKPTADQLVQYEKFTRCTRYAAKLKDDLALSAVYETGARGGQTAVNVAFLDAYYAPEVVSINAQSYEGVAGNLILIKARDNFKVDKLTVSIISSDNELIEEGQAVDGMDGLSWEYVVTQANANIAGTKVVAKATDLAGNSTSLEVSL